MEKGIYLGFLTGSLQVGIQNTGNSQQQCGLEKGVGGIRQLYEWEETNVLRN